MSVIFKEKNYDQLLLILKKMSIIILLLLIFITIFNFSYKNKLENLETEIEAVKTEELKYNSLITELNQKEKLAGRKNNNYSNIIKLANYAEDITYNSLHYKNKKITIDAVSSQQDRIFKLTDTLKKDKKFKNVDLININQQDKFYFQLEVLLF
ncbi:MAG: PilN domain-containing protein [Halanaerobium sp.]